ncbi:MAG: ATP-binding protein, partial [Egibacteraceae bacterium]
VAATRLREALALWRGDVLADLPGYDFVEGEQARLAGLRQAALEARVDADLELGRHAELIPELEALVAADPLRERTWGQLMVALYRAGRQARALAAYETVRRTLAEELGLDPGPELQRIERAILRQDSALQPATGSVAASLGNLPAPLTNFIGRGEEIAQLQQLMASSRLVTMVGAGGTGKTRLALQTAAELTAEFSDGVWLVDLAPVRDPARVPLALAASLKVRDEPGLPMIDTLADYLRHAQVLIVLDNCEHLVEACAELAAALLRACPGVRVLATSQEALAVPGEVAWLLPPLSAASALALFADRAASAGFRPSRDTEPYVAQICRHLDGIPLAIELAAARLKTLSVRQIAERLDDRFQLLSQVTRGAPARHRTLSAMVNWSYDLLGERERMLFDRLSVFAGGFTLDAIEAVGTLGDDTVDVLGRLVDKSFVLRADGGSGLARYRLLETLRQYGHQRLEQRGEMDEVRSRHAAYYLALAEETAPHLVGQAAGPDSGVWLDRLDAERANLRAALAWAFDGGDVTAGLRTTLAGWWLWNLRGPYGEGRQLIQAALEHGDEATPPVRIGLLFGAGFLAAAQCDFEEAAAVGQQCLALARRHGDDRHVALASYVLGATAWVCGDGEHGRRLLKEAVVITRRLGDRWTLAMALALLSRVTVDHGDPQQGAILSDDSVRLAREVGEPFAIGMALGFRAEVACLRQEDELAATLADQALVSCLAVGYAPGILLARSILAVAAERRGDVERAAGLLLECLIACRQIRCRRGTAMCLEALARVAAGDQPVAAARLLGAADALRAEIGAPVLAAERADHARHVASVRSALGAEAFAAAWAAGKALTTEQAFIEVTSLFGEDNLAQLLSA